MLVGFDAVYDNYMIMFEAKFIYGVEDGAGYVRWGELHLGHDDAGDESMTAAQAQTGLDVGGLTADDYGLIGTVVDYAGVSELPFLVTSRHKNISHIVSASMVARQANRYTSPDLARKLQQARPEDIALFGAEALLRELNLRFPFRA